MLIGNRRIMKNKTGLAIKLTQRILMRKNRILIVSIIAFGIIDGCNKNKGFYNYKQSTGSFNGNIYDFLKSQPHQFDSFLYAVDRVKLTDSLKDGSYTVFAPVNISFEQTLSAMNALRVKQGRQPLDLSSVPLDQLDTLISRYIIRGKIPSDSMKYQDGLDMPTIGSGYLMNGKITYVNAEGLVNGGPGIITYSDRKGSVYTNRWVSASTVAIDMKASNGYVNILDKNHIIGFGEFIQRMDPTYSIPFLGYPLPIPSTIGLQLYDLGGEGVAYHDNDASNNGGKFRPNEGVDIENAGNGENGYDIGWTNPFEWMNYTVNIAEPGQYEGFIRAASPNNDGRLHLELDGQDITGPITIPGTGGYQNYNNIYFVTKPLPAGVHVLKLFYDFTVYNLRFLHFVPLNRPFPIPGTIGVENFNQGGEGVGYHDRDSRNNGGRYRLTEGVDIEQDHEGGYDVGWTNPGEWMAYTVNVLHSGMYYIDARVGSPGNPNGGHNFHFEFDGKTVGDTLTCPNTGGWQNWTNVRESVYLTKGVHLMTFYENDGGYNIKSYTFTAIQ